MDALNFLLLAANLLLAGTIVWTMILTGIM
jgi:hypothetical protein